MACWSTGSLLLLARVPTHPCYTNCPCKPMQSMDHVESMLEYWQQWRLQLRELFQEAQVGAVARADALMHYWQVVQPAAGAVAGAPGSLCT